MNTRVRFSLVNKLLIVLSLFCFTAMSSFAAENSLSGIDVKQIDNTYNVTLKMDKAVNIKKILKSDENLTLVLNSTLPAESVDIIYDNAADLENVIVQKKDDGNTLILIQGKNIKNTNIATKELSTGTIKQNNNNGNITTSNFYIADYKLVSYSIIGFVMFLALMLMRKPKSKKTSQQTQSTNRKQIKATTLRTKVLAQDRVVPSINYEIKSNSSKVSIPKDFVVNSKYYQEEEQIRKVG